MEVKTWGIHWCGQFGPRLEQPWGPQSGVGGPGVKLQLRKGRQSGPYLLSLQETR